ncbi:MAG: hypothetical protein RIC56_02700 [Pseudomonadales bacterium]
MEVVARSDEYTIYRKRNQRYAIRNKQRQWVRGDDKVAILLNHKLIEAPKPKAPEPAAVAEAEAPEAEAEGAKQAAAEADAPAADAEEEKS